MSYIVKNCRNKLVMNRFREIASVRLPGNRFRRRHMTPKGMRPGITLSIVQRSSALRAITLSIDPRSSALRAITLSIDPRSSALRAMSPKGIRPVLLYASIQDLLLYEPFVRLSIRTQVRSKPHPIQMQVKPMALKRLHSRSKPDPSPIQIHSAEMVIKQMVFVRLPIRIQV